MIHLIITAANMPEAYDIRKQWYIESIESCLKHADLFDTYTVLECVSPHEDYLDGYNTYYSKQPNSFNNKGLNELSHLKAFIANNITDPDTAIIKLSGKYVLTDDYFLSTVNQLHTDFDSIFKNDNDVYVGNGYHTFLYYVKQHRFFDMIKDISFSNDNDTPIEWDIKAATMTQDRHVEIDRLGVLARQGQRSEKIFTC